MKGRLTTMNINDLNNQTDILETQNSDEDIPITDDLEDMMSTSGELSAGASNYSK